MVEAERREAAKKFYIKWQNRGKEDEDDRSYWIDFLQDVFGVDHVTDRIEFQKKVIGANGKTKKIDAYIPETRVLIEQKSLNIPLDKPQAGHDGMTPYEQAKMYDNYLPVSEKSKWIILSNFAEIWVYDMDTKKPEPVKFQLFELPDKYGEFEFLINTKQQAVHNEEMEISVKAGEFVGLMYEALHKEYINPYSEQSLKSLNKLCVWLVFCLYAEDAHIFGPSGHMFHDYLAQYEVKDMRKALIELFKILNIPEDDRDPYDTSDLSEFPYVNGALFKDVEDVEIPNFTDEISDILLNKASDGFDWSKISPTIFGAVFESTLNPETRRSGGMHYTSIENIHKVIDTLFLDELKEEYENISIPKDVTEVDKKALENLIKKEEIARKENDNATVQEVKKKHAALKRAISRKTNENVKAEIKALEQFQIKLSKLTFLDPACGSGNFLTETYISLRRLENQVIRDLFDLRPNQTDGQIAFGDVINPIKVGIGQFYGIEINDFAVTVGKTALWIAESQMMKETEDIISMSLDFLPLKTNANIIRENALLIDWENIIPSHELKYLMGNPPFVGARLMSKEQQFDRDKVLDGWKNYGDLDYVTCWFKKAAEYVKGSFVKAALVATNSITQGEVVPFIWKPLKEMGISIDFAYRTFIWDSEATIKAHVYCVIIGFSSLAHKTAYIYDGSSWHQARNISGYLIDFEDIYAIARTKPLCNVPEIGIGNLPIDDGNYLFTEEEKNAFINAEPKSEKYFKKWYGAKEYLNNKPRYCLWLGDCTPSELRSMPECLKRVENVRNFRLASKRKQTNRIAETPTHFCTENMPKEDYLLIPRVSSEKRRYIPIGYMTPDSLSSDACLIMPNASLYYYGILTSNVHMAWVRTVCGRLKSDYRYSVGVVYNNFPWPSLTDEQKKKIERTAQAILAERALYPDSSLADLYDPRIMPKELQKAHKENDDAVMRAYGFSTKDTSEDDFVPMLMEMYKELTS